MKRHLAAPRRAITVAWLVFAGCECPTSHPVQRAQITGPHELHVNDAAVLPISMIGGAGPGVVIVLSNTGDVCDELRNGWHPADSAALTVMLQEATEAGASVTPTPGVFTVSSRGGQQGATPKFAGVAFAVTDSQGKSSAPAHATDGTVELTSLELHGSGVSHGRFHLMFGDHGIDGEIRASYCEIHH